MSVREPVFTPFLRRFTDERANDIAETARLYHRVTSAHRGTVLVRKDAVEHVSNHIASVVTEVVDLPSYVPLGGTLDKLQQQILSLEATIFSSPEVDFSRPITLRQQVDLNQFLRAQEYFLTHQERLSELLVTTVANLSAGIIQSLPPIAPSAFTVPLINLLPNARHVVDALIGTVMTSELADAGLFTALQDRIFENMCKFSRVAPDQVGKKQIVPAAEADIAPEELVVAFLGGTPFEEFFQQPVPFAIPEETRFSGHWIIAPPGRGKTTLLHAMFLDDVGRDACIIVMDSKGDLIDPIRKLAAIKDRLLIIEPDPEYPLALNPLDMPKATLTQVVDNLEYVFSALLETKTTALQQTLFRSILRALVLAFPNPTLLTFRDIVANGIKPYTQYIKALPDDLQDFFYREFPTKTYEGTRDQLNWRLRLLLENEIISKMFTAPQTRFHIGKEMDTPGRIILINNSYDMLGDQGTEFFSRYFIAQVLSAATARSGRRPGDKLPVYFYIDECGDVIRRDPKFVKILDTCRSQKIAIIAAHQRTNQVEDEVLSALANCAVRMTNSDDEAGALSKKLRTSTEFLQSLPVGTFAAFVRDLTPQALAFRIPFIDMSALPKMTAPEQRAIRDRMREQFSFSPQQSSPAARSSSVTREANATGSLGERASDATHEQGEPLWAGANPDHPGISIPDSSPSPSSDPHTGDHTKPATKWGDE